MIDEPEPELNEEEIKRQQALIREVHGIPEPEEEQPPTPEGEKEEDNGEKKPKVEVPEHILKLDLPKIAVVSNLSKKATDVQIKTLFGFIGEVEDCATFPAKGVPCAARCAFVKFYNPYDSGVATHLTNTVFIDRPLTVEIYRESNKEMPDESTGIKYMTPLEAEATYGKTKNEADGHGIREGENLAGRGRHNYLYTTVEDTPAIERTIHVENIDGVLVSEISLIQFFTIAGEINNVKIVDDEALVEFYKGKSVEAALKLNDATFLGRKLKIRPAIERDQVLRRVKATEDEDTMRRVLAAQTLIEEVVQAENHDEAGEYIKRERVKREHKVKKERRRSRSRSRDRKHRRRRRSRSGSRDRSSSKSKHKKHKREKRYD